MKLRRPWNNDGASAYGRVYQYQGNIAAYQTGRNMYGQKMIETVQLYEQGNEEKAPILLHCSTALVDYIEDMEGHDAEEKYMEKIFVYDTILYLRQIWILNRSGEVVKAIIDADDRTNNRRCIVVGPQDLIEDENAKALRKSEYMNPV